MSQQRWMLHEKEQETEVALHGIIGEHGHSKTKIALTRRCFVFLMISGGCGGATKGSSSHSLLYSLSIHPKHSSVPGGQPALWTGDTTLPHLLAVKEIPAEYTDEDKKCFHFKVVIYGTGQNSLVGSPEDAHGTLIPQLWVSSGVPVECDGTRWHENWRRTREI